MSSRGTPAEVPAPARSKGERLREAERDPRLERRRFVLSRVPELRERIFHLQKVFSDLQKEHPELVGLSLYGSHTKGYADFLSDIDGVVFVDFDEAQKRGTDKLELRRLVQETVRKELGLTSEHVSIDAVSISLQNNSVTTLRTPRLFHLAIGDKLRPYRDAAIRSYEEKGEEGEREWARLVFELVLHENHTFSDEFVEKRLHLYPWSLKKARAYYAPERGSDYTESSVEDSA
ncbi:hypothetical protein K2Y00_03760 [Patescibacteria group bacterium]|nr:hypothetical protein [Patescibacteria group bacterium]